MITIIGAGLSGLATAFRLHQAGVPVSVLEANPFAGGRIQPAMTNGSGHQDLGPSWVWPYAQPSVVDWFDELGIATFEQYDTGDALLDSHPTAPPRQQFLPGQHGIARVHGGTHAIVQALVEQLPDVIQHNCVVTDCTFDKQAVEVIYKREGTANTIKTDAVVIATPPRLAIPMLDDPELKNVTSVLQQTPTWMAPHAKVVMFYKQPFWRERGLSGRVASQVGPMVEVHDHSGPDGSPAALFGFVGVPATQRAEAEAVLITAVKQQLQRCFGDDAPEPEKVVIKDWAFEQFTSTAADLAGPGAHPSVVDAAVRKPWCDKRLWFAASETSSVSPGLIEGALARADQLAKDLIAAM